MERTQIEFERWAGYLTSLGVETDSETLEASLWRVTRGYLSLRKTLVAPFEEYVSWLGLWQGWAMFSSPQTRPAALYVEVEQAGRWTVVFQPRSDQHDWKRRQFDQNRLRKLSGRLARRADTHLYDELVNWLAREAARDFPEATRMRVRLRRWRSPGREARHQGDLPLGTLGDERVIDLGAFR